MFIQHMGEANEPAGRLDLRNKIGLRFHAAMRAPNSLVIARRTGQALEQIGAHPDVMLNERFEQHPELTVIRYQLATKKEAPENVVSGACCKVGASN